MAGKLWQLQTCFWDLRPKSEKKKISHSSKMFAVFVDFPLFVPLFCPTKISLGLFGPIFPWSRELIAAILEPKRFGI
jgi:hypothetical protein